MDFSYFIEIVQKLENSLNIDWQKVSSLLTWYYSLLDLIS